MKRYAENLKQWALAHPAESVLIAAATVTAVAKLMDANTQRTYARAHVLEVNRRIAMNAR